LACAVRAERAARVDADTADLSVGAAEAAFAEILPRWQPLPSLGSPDDIAQAALFLASDAARLINGHNLIIDGGITAGWPAATARADLQRFREKFRAEIASP
jgi:NAD(P)-dependent dehydrogenase (short-subunit alcohol dehydrogenase family)